MDEQVTTNTIIGRKDHDVDDEAEEEAGTADADMLLEDAMAKTTW